MNRASGNFLTRTNLIWRLPLDGVLHGAAKRHLRLAERLSALEAEIAVLEHERAYLLDADGNILVKRDGDLDSVTFDDAELGNVALHTITHNHRDGDALTIDSDVALAAEENAQQVRAVGRAPDGNIYLYVVTRPAQGWGDLVQKLKRAEAQMLPDVRAKYRTTDASDAVISHDIWTRLKERTGVLYRREILSQQG